MYKIETSGKLLCLCSDPWTHRLSKPQDRTSTVMIITLHLRSNWDSAKLTYQPSSNWVTARKYTHTHTHRISSAGMKNLFPRPPWRIFNRMTQTMEEMKSICRVGASVFTCWFGAPEKKSISCQCFHITRKSKPPNSKENFAIFFEPTINTFLGWPALSMYCS